jgi:putative hydrolase of the HAD superfamily
VPLNWEDWAAISYDSGLQVQAIFLDLDATLLNYDNAAWAATVRAVCSALRQADHGADLDAEALFATYTRISSAYFLNADTSPERHADGHAIWRELWRQALAGCGRDDGATADAAVAAYEADRAVRYELFGDVLPTLAHLRERVTSLVLITNGPGSTQRHKAEATGLTSLLDAVIISGETGVAKPDPAIFMLAARAAGVPPEAAWHVGDSLTSDVAGARNAGLGAGVWLNRAAASHPGTRVAPQPHYEIASLTELPGLLC